MARKKLGEMLIEAGLIDEQALRGALGEQRRWGGTIGRILVDMRAVSEPALVDALSKQLNLPGIDLDQCEIPREVLDHVPGELAQQWGLVPFAQKGKFLEVAMTDPTNLGIVDELRIRTQLNVRPYIAGPKAIERAVARWYHRGGDAIGRDKPPPILGEDVLDLDPRANALPVPSGAPRGAAMTPPRPTATIRAAATTPPALPIAAGLELASPGTSSNAGGYGNARPFPRGAPTTIQPPVAASPAERDAEVAALQNRLSKLEALVARDEDILRKLFSLLIDKGVASRDEILDRIK
jgi:hypothetical protein